MTNNRHCSSRSREGQRHTVADIQQPSVADDFLKATNQRVGVRACIPLHASRACLYRYNTFIYLYIHVRARRGEDRLDSFSLSHSSPFDCFDTHLRQRTQGLGRRCHTLLRLATKEHKKTMSILV